MPRSPNHLRLAVGAICEIQLRSIISVRCCGKNPTLLRNCCISKAGVHVVKALQLVPIRLAIE